MLSHMLHNTLVSTADKAPALIGSCGNVDFLAFALLAPVTMYMAPMGAKLAHRLPAANLRRIFAGFLAVIAIKMVASAL